MTAKKGKAGTASSGSSSGNTSAGNTDVTTMMTTPTIETSVEELDALNRKLDKERTNLIHVVRSSPVDTINTQLKTNAKVQDISLVHEHSVEYVIIKKGQYPMIRVPKVKNARDWLEGYLTGLGFEAD